MNKKVFVSLLMSSLMAACGGGAQDDGNPDAGEGVINYTTSRTGIAGGFVDINGDGKQDLLVGSPEAQTAKSKAGVVSVRLANDTHIEDAELLSLHGEADGDFYGFSFSNLGDVNADGKEDFAVGAINAEGDAGLSGAVYVYQGGSYPVKLLAKLNGEEAFSKFGFSIAAGDVNGDGTNDVIVAAPYTFSEEFQAGAVYIYFGGETLSQNADIVIKGDKVNASVGFAVAAGDVNGDDVDDIIMDGHAKVFIYYGGADVKERIATNSKPNVQIRSDSGRHGGSGFGYAIAYAGDVDRDGYGDIAIGNPRRSSPSTYDNAGSFYIFRGGENMPLEIWEDDVEYRLVKVVGTANNEHFGSSILMIGDVNQEARPDFLVGANWANGGEDGKELIAGNLYLFYGENLLVQDPTQDHQISLATHSYPMSESSGEFGTAVAIKGHTIFAGAPGSNKHDGDFVLTTIHDGKQVVLGDGTKAGQAGHDHHH